MKLVKRWGIMALVALLVLGSMGAALADEGDEPETVEEAVPFGADDGFALEWVGSLVNFVFYWGSEAGEDGLEGAPPECVTSGEEPVAGSIFLPAPDPDEDSGECVALDIAGPNGQVNHGSMVSAFVHWLKDDVNLETLSLTFEDMPNGKGRFVSQVAKYGLDVSDLSGDGDESAAEAEEEDGDGPPDWVKEKKAAKAEGKGKK